MIKKRIATILFLVSVLLLIPVVALADGDYVAGEDGTLYAQVLNGDGSPANAANVTLTLWAADGDKILDEVTMTYVTASQGIYKYDFTCPEELGTYIADVVSASPTGYGSSTIHVSELFAGNVTVTGSNATAIWGTSIVGFTDSSTFGGLINDILGGGIMPMLFILGILGLGFTIAFFWTRSGVLAYGAAGSWVLLGFTAFQQSPSSAPIPITDTYLGLFWLCIAFTIACVLLPSVMREKPSKDDIYPEEVDEVTGEKIVREEPKQKKRRSKIGRLFDGSGQL